MRPVYSTTTKIPATLVNTVARSSLREVVLARFAVPFIKVSGVPPAMLRPPGLEEYLSMPSCCCEMFGLLHMYWCLLHFSYFP